MDNNLAIQAINACSQAISLMLDGHNMMAADKLGQAQGYLDRHIQLGCSPVELNSAADGDLYDAPTSSGGDDDIYTPTNEPNEGTPECYDNEMNMCVAMTPADL